MFKLRNPKTNNSQSPFPLPKPAPGFPYSRTSQTSTRKAGCCQAGGGDEFRNRGATDGRNLQVVLHVSPCVNPDGHKECLPNEFSYHLFSIIHTLFLCFSSDSSQKPGSSLSMAEAVASGVVLLSFGMNPGCHYQASSQGLCQHQPEEEEGSILL